MQPTESSKEDGGQAPSYTFDVFLSYSRKDRDFAAKLEDALERYRIPKSLARGKRSLNVFRDEADIEAAEDYYRTIDQHLKVARKLIVVCSPDARRSQYVQDEIRRFIELHGEKDIIPVLVRGKANNEAADENEKAFPEILCNNKMPLAANFLGGEAHKGKLSKGQFRGSWYSVLAAVNGIDRRRLEQVEEKMRARRRAVALGVAGGVILLLSVALVLTLISRRQAVVARNEAFAREIAANALAQLPSDPDLSLLLAVEAAKRGRLRETENTLRHILAASPLHVLHLGDPDPLSASAATYALGGKLVVTASAGTLSAFDTGTGRRVYERRFDGPLGGTASGPGGRLVAVLASPPETSDESAVPAARLHICEAATGNDVARWEVGGGASELLFSPDEKFLVTHGRMGATRVWEVASGRAVAEVEGESPEFSGDGRFLLTKVRVAVEGKNSEAKVYVVETGSWKRVAEIPTVRDMEEGLSMFGAISPDGKVVAAGSDGGVLRLHETNGGREAKRVSVAARGGWPREGVFSPDGRFVAFGIYGDSTLWDIDGGQPYDLSKFLNPVDDLSFSPDGRFLLAVGDSKARLHNVSYGRLNHSHQWNPGRFIREFRAVGGGSLEAAEFSPDGQSVLTTNDDGTAYVWDLRAVLAQAVQPLARDEDDMYVSAADFSPDGKLVATVGDGVRVWEVSSGRMISSAESPARLSSVMFSPVGSLLLTTDETSAHVRDYGSGRVVTELKHGGSLAGAAYSPDGKLIVTAGAQGAKLWDAGNGGLLAEIPSEGEVTGAQFSPDGKRVLIASAGQARVWELDSKRVVLTVGEARDGGGIVKAVYSPDAKYILTWEDPTGIYVVNSLQVRDARTGRALFGLHGHSDDLRSVTFSPGGEFVLTTSGYNPPGSGGVALPDTINEARVWDLASGSTIYEFRDHGGPVLAGSFGTDGKSVMVIGESGAIHVYACELCGSQEELLRLAEKRARRGLSEDERGRYLHESQPNE